MGCYPDLSNHLFGDMKLMAIQRDGTITELTAPLPDIARSVIDATVQKYSSAGWDFPWIGYLALEEGVCVGACGFKGSPKNEAVEIAYFTFPGHEGRGVATRMAEGLLSIARASAPDLVVTAQTLPQESASTRILRKLGFSLKGSVVHPEDGTVWEWFHEKENTPNQHLQPTPR